MSTLLQAENLCWRAGVRVRLDQVSLNIAAGELVGIIGSNGAGKSSLLQLLAGLQQPDSGLVTFNGNTLTKQTPRWRACHIGYLEQRPVVHWPFTVEQVVSLARLPFSDRNLASGSAAVAHALSVVGIENFRQLAFNELSEGEKMRVQIARLLAGTPKLLLADEPTASLDLARQQEVLSLLREQVRNGAAVAVTLHDLGAAARYCDRLILLHHGRQLASGTPAEVLQPQFLAHAFGAVE